MRFGTVTEKNNDTYKVKYDCETEPSHVNFYNFSAFDIAIGDRVYVDDECSIIVGRRN